MSDQELPFAHGGPPLSGRLKSEPEDFQVDEIESFPPDGEGEHAWLRIRKKNANTDWLAQALAGYCGVKSLDVGYAGMKDRNAVTVQAFTVHLPGRETPNWREFETQNEGVTILDSARHSRKLKRGALEGNRFRIRLRECSGDRGLIDEVLSRIRDQGVPNYFGEQRFGIDGANVARAEQMFSNPKQMRRMSRSKRSIMLSASRSHLFNVVLAQRVRQGNWNQSLAGEVWNLAGSRSWFGPEENSAELDDRLARADIHPSAPLWGRGPLPTAGPALELEKELLQPFELIRGGLERAGLDQERRATRLIPSEMRWKWIADSDLEMSFSLPPGCYATTVVREVCDSVG